VLGPACGWPRPALTTAEIDHKEDKSKTQADAGRTQSDGAHRLSPRRVRIKARLLNGLGICGGVSRLFLFLAMQADSLILIRQSVRCGILLSRYGILLSACTLAPLSRLPLSCADLPLSCAEQCREIAITYTSHVECG
jgi:hypothetical protein